MRLHASIKFDSLERDYSRTTRHGSFIISQSGETRMPQIDRQASTR